MRAHGAHAQAWLVFFSFTESSFLLIAPDLLLVAMLLAGSERWFYFATLTVAASVAGGIFGYVIGAFFFDTVGIRVVEFYGIMDEIESMKVLFDANAFWTIFIAAFTPIPYKVFVLAGGFFKIDFLIFIVASILGRGLRYYIIAYIVHLYGERVARILLRYFNISAIALVVLTVLYILYIVI